MKDKDFSKETWFTLSDKKREGRRFLQWAKEQGCVWVNGKEIDPSNGTDFFTLCITEDGKLSNVPAWLVVSEQSKGVRRVVFKDYYRALKKAARK